MTVDLIGRELTDAEERLLGVYVSLKDLCREDLDPVAASGVRAALALIHNTVSSLGLVYEHLADLGV